MSSPENKPLSVGELSSILKACFENPAFGDLTVYGEVYSIRVGGKFAYLDLGDQGKNQTSSPVLRCAFSCFYGDNYGLENVKSGDVVQIRGSLSYYPHGSSITFWGKKLQVLQNQLGTNLIKKRKTLEKLEKLGYLDESRKRPIPKFCKKVAILTAKDGAAYQDILKTLHDRFPVDSVLYPITVQGDSASSSIVKALAAANNDEGYDALIIGRGGGSKTDLSCFDDEKVALAIATSKIPVITCIGHTIDTAIADRVSDVKAITPTEGASLINPSLEEIQEDYNGLKEQLDSLFKSKLQEKALALDNYASRLKSLSPLNNIKNAKSMLDDYFTRLNDLFSLAIRNKTQEKQNFIFSLDSNYQNRLIKEKSLLQRYDSLLEKSNPQTIALKGYALIYKDGKKIHSSLELKAGDKALITFIDGRKNVKVTD